MKTKIQLVEDDPDFSSAVKIILENAGYDCTAANSARQGLQMISYINPDLILLDIMLEDISAGFRFIQEIREKDTQTEKTPIPILVVTSIQKVIGLNLRERVGTSLFPVEGFLEKPVEPETLLNQISNMITPIASHCKCEGKTEDRHTGTAIEYDVFDPISQIDWGHFYYCDECARIDRERGFIVQLG